MSHFLGEFDCKLDAKGRMMLPSGLRKQIDVKSGSDFTPYEFNFSVDKTVAEGDYDFFSLMLVGNENGGKFRNLKLVLVG